MFPIAATAIASESGYSETLHLRRITSTGVSLVSIASPVSDHGYCNRSIPDIFSLIRSVISVIVDYTADLTGYAGKRHIYEAIHILLLSRL